MIKTQRLPDLDQIRAFLAGTKTLGFEAPGREAADDWIAGELRRFGCLRLSKPDKGLVRRYLEKVTGRSRAQGTRLLTQFRNTGRIRDRHGRKRDPHRNRQIPWRLPSARPQCSQRASGPGCVHEKPSGRSPCDAVENTRVGRPHASARGRHPAAGALFGHSVRRRPELN